MYKKLVLILIFLQLFSVNCLAEVIINQTNMSAGTSQEVLSVANLKNIIFQYKLVAGASNTIEVQFWGTVYTDAVDGTDADWLNVTTFLTGLGTLSVTSGTLHDMSLIDSNCTFAKIKVKYIVTASAPDNTLKVGWNTDK